MRCQRDEFLRDISFDFHPRLSSTLLRFPSSSSFLPIVVSLHFERFDGKTIGSWWFFWHFQLLSLILSLRTIRYNIPFLFCLVFTPDKEDRSSIIDFPTLSLSNTVLFSLSLSKNDTWHSSSFNFYTFPFNSCASYLAFVATFPTSPPLSRSISHAVCAHRSLWILHNSSFYEIFTAQMSASVLNI